MKKNILVIALLLAPLVYANDEDPISMHSFFKDAQIFEKRLKGADCYFRVFSATAGAIKLTMSNHGMTREVVINRTAHIFFSESSKAAYYYRVYRVKGVGYITFKHQTSSFEDFTKVTLGAGRDSLSCSYRDGY